MTLPADDSVDPECDVIPEAGPARSEDDRAASRPSDGETATESDEHHAAIEPVGAMRPPSSSASWRLDALGEQLSRSHAELKSTTARYGEVAGRIPSDINDMKDRLSTILRAATEEAEAIVADARQTATKLREDATALAEETARAHRSAEKDRDEAAKLAAEAKREHQSVTEMRATLEAKTKQFEAETTRTRDEVARESAELMRNAEARAEKTLKDVQRDIDSHIAEAEAKLAELNRIREDIVTQIRAFYDRFSMLEFAGGGSGGAGTVSPVVNVASFARSQRRGDAKSARPAAPSHPPGGDRRLPGGA